MTDVSRSTISRSGCKAGGALLMSSRHFFTAMKYEFQEEELPGGVKLAFYSYRQDATNHRSKKCTMELGAAYGMFSKQQLQKIDEADKEFDCEWSNLFSGIRRVSDVIPVQDESGAGCLGFTRKAFASLGCPDWEQTQQTWILGLASRCFFDSTH